MYFNVTKCSSLALCCLLSLSLSAKDAKSVESQGLRKPLCFVENKGQVTDQFDHPRHDIQYSLATPGMTLYVGEGQLHYQFKKTEGTPSTEGKVTTYRMDVSLVGANPAAKVEATGKQSYFENYYLAQLSKDGVTAHSWNKITYKEVYPNIDWVIYVKGSNVEYDFTVRPGGKVSDIKLAYDGATALNMTEDGGLAAETPMGIVREKKPYAYENGNGKEVAANFKLNGNILTFETGNYNGVLTIDPNLIWSTYFGGAGQDVATGIAVDAANNSYVSGYTGSTGLATTGSFMSVYAGGTFDAFLAKYNSAGVLQFATYVGGTGTDQGTCVALESAGANVYLGGTTTSIAAGIATPGAFHVTNNGGNDGFLMKFNSTGTRQWCTFYGGLANDNINSVATDGANNVIITGQTASTSFIATGAAYQAARSGTTDAFLAKFSSVGAVQWSTYYGGSAQEQGFGVKCNAAGAIYITGQTNSIVSIASTGAFQTALSGTFDAFIAQFSAAGSRVWGSYLGGNNSEQGNAIAVDPATGNIAIAGNTSSTTGLASPRALQTTFGAGGLDAFLAYFDGAGNRIWTTYYGGASLDYGQAVCFDLYGNVLMAGGTFSASGISTAGSFQSAIGGDYDAYVLKTNNLGQRLWGTYFGGTFYDYANGIAYSNNNEMLVAGHTTSDGLYGAGGITTAGAAQTTFGGSVYDAFIAKFSTDTFVVVNQPYVDTIVCAGGSLNVSYTVYAVGSMFRAGNTFTVQLSNSAGSFFAPVNIGTVSSVTSGIITCTIPPGTTPGTGYRIRIVSSSPAFTSPDNNVNIRVVPSLGPTTAWALTPKCVGSTIQLYDSATYTVSSYSWTGPFGFVSALQNPTITPATLANAGVYSVTTVHNGCPPSTSITTVEINNFTPPTPTLNATSGCAGSPLSLFSDPDTTATSIIYAWTGPGGYTSTDRNPVISPASVANTGYYFLQDTIGGCASAQTYIYVTVAPVLPVSVTIQASPGYTPGAAGDTICAGDLVSFTAFPVNGGSTPHYQWMTGVSSPVVGAISNTWASASLTDGTGVFCILTSSVDCPLPASASSNTIKMNVITHAPIIYIYATPGLHVTPGSNITFYSAVYDAGILPTYQWQKNGVDIPGATNSSYTKTAITRTDTITLVVTSTMGCTADPIGISNKLVIMTNVGVSNVAAALEDITMFPNPNSGSFTVKGSLTNMSNGSASFDVTDLLGQVVYSEVSNIQNNELNHAITINNLSPGVYFLRVGVNGDSKIFRFVKQ